MKIKKNENEEIINDKEKQIEKNSSINTNIKSELKELFEDEKLKTETLKEISKEEKETNIQKDELFWNPKNKNSKK